MVVTVVGSSNDDDSQQIVQNSCYISYAQVCSCKRISKYVVAYIRYLFQHAYRGVLSIKELLQAGKGYKLFVRGTNRAKTNLEADPHLPQPQLRPRQPRPGIKVALLIKPSFRLTPLCPGVWQGQPEREYDGEQEQVGDLLLQALLREPHVQGLGIDLTLAICPRISTLRAVSCRLICGLDTLLK